EAGARRNPSAQKLDACALKLVQRPRFGCGQHSDRRIESTRLEARILSRKRTLRAPDRIDRECHGALQKRGCGRDPAAGLSPAGRQLELERNVLVGCERRLSPMPGATIRIERDVGGLGQRSMYVSTLVGGRSSVDRRPKQGVAKRDSRTNGDEIVRFGGSGCFDRKPEHGSSSPQ